MEYIPDDPMIRQLEAYGYPAWMDDNEDGYDDVYAVYDPD